MIKNQSNIYQFVLRDMIGQGMTGLSPTVQIRKDSGSFAATSNTPTEVGYGAYEVILTATECNCDVMMFMVTLPDGQFPAILTNEYLTTTGGATPAEIWQYNGQGGRTVTNTIPTASDNAQAVWGAQTKEVTIATAQAETFATASALTTVGNNVSAIKAKTDNLPQNPAAVGSEMALTSAAISTVQNGLATSSELSALQTHGDSTWNTATGFATPTNVSEAKADIISAIPTDYAKPGNAMTLTSSTLASVVAGVWNYDNRELTQEIVSQVTAEDIASISIAVWSYVPRKLTSIVSDVIEPNK